MPKVLNKYHGPTPEGAVNIMRPGPYQNPFIIGRDGTREEVVAKHKQWVDTNPVYKRIIRKELHGKDLICCCAPRPCHGDYLLKVANS